MKIGIIGGGASGLVAAISAKDDNNEVTIYEKNNACCKKILVTGNGKCNYFNDNFNIEFFNSSNIEILSNIINDINKNKILNFFDNLGIISKINNGYYYPYSNQAITIKEALIKEANLRGIKIINNVEILDIKYDTEFTIITSNEIYKSDKIILATGSKAAPKTGSTGIGYILANKLGHNVIKPLPALVQLKGKESYFKDWSGIRTDVKVSWYENNQFIKSEIGEIQLTDYGVSGICIFQLSGKIIRGLESGNKEEISINFLPWLNEDINNFFNNRKNKLKGRTISELLDGMLNYKLVNLILKKNKIKNDRLFNDLSNDEIKKIYKDLTNFRLCIIDYNDFDCAQVCSGGIPLTEINIHTMESNIQKNLYIVGELLDVDGACGGYNLGFAWLSGLLAGENIKENYD